MLDGDGELVTSRGIMVIHTTMVDGILIGTTEHIIMVDGILAGTIRIIMVDGMVVITHTMVMDTIIIDMDDITKWAEAHLIADPAVMETIGWQAVDTVLLAIVAAGMLPSDVVVQPDHHRQEMLM